MPEIDATGDCGRNRIEDEPASWRPARAPEPGVWGIANTQRKVGRDGPLVDARGFAELRVRHLAAGAVLGERPNSSSLELEHELVTLCESCEQLSVMVQDTTGTVRVIEGTGVPAGAGPAGLIVLARGTTSTAYRLEKAGAILAVRSGFDLADELGTEFHEALRLVPSVRPATAEDIPAAQGARSDLKAAFLIQGPGADFTTAAAGCLFFATDLEMPEGMVWGYFWAPDGSGLVSEYGSIRADDLRLDGGRIDSWSTALTLREVVSGALGPSRTKAYRRLRGSDSY